ncbi:hypothetical protein [Spirosoma spitsbergense]|nr:hypothetical protein [Spirosoma spitsbergense]
MLCTGNRDGDPADPQPDGTWVFAVMNNYRRIRGQIKAFSQAFAAQNVLI